jgi:hypothetical protein
MVGARRNAAFGWAILVLGYFMSDTIILPEIPPQALSAPSEAK